MPPVRGEAKQENTTTCDRCRQLKVKCLLPDGETSGGSASPLSLASRGPCQRCIKSSSTCTFEYTFKKSGRPAGTKNRPSLPARPSEPEPPLGISPSALSATSHIVPSIGFSPLALDNTAFRPRSPPTSGHILNNLPPFPTSDDNAFDHLRGPAADSIFGSARTALEAPTYATWLDGQRSRRASFDFTIPGPSPDTGMMPSIFPPGPFDAPQNTMPMPQQQGAQPDMFGMPARTSSGTGMGNDASISGTGNGWNGSMIGDQTKRLDKQSPNLASAVSLNGPMSQIESVGSWAEFCGFFSLFLRHQHALVPVIHKPSFAMDIVNRRDQKDEAFRGLLFSIVTYTICQCPVNLMTHACTRERLLELLEACQQASRIVQLRHLSRPSLVIAASTALDILSSQATNKPDLTATLFSDAQRIIYSLRLNIERPTEGLNVIETELSRRIFWQLYNTDKTNAMNGGTLLVANHEGIPPLPIDVDDDLISAGGVMPSLVRDHAKQPKPYISGFIAVSKIFRILGECQVRHRTLLNDPAASQAVDIMLRWLRETIERLRAITDKFRSDRTRNGDVSLNMPPPSNSMLDASQDSDATAGIQHANITITALCAEFALLDFKMALKPDEDLGPQREQIAKKAYRTLSSIPIEYLASNGEAMRGKVLRTILALFSASSDPEELGSNVWDWWSMYSQVQFIQVIPQP